MVRLHIIWPQALTGSALFSEIFELDNEPVTNLNQIMESFYFGVLKVVFCDNYLNIFVTILGSVTMLKSR